MLSTIRKYKNMPKLLVKIRHTKGVKQTPETPCTFPPCCLAHFPVVWPSKFRWITWEPMARFGWNFVLRCKYLLFPRLVTNFWSYTWLFLVHCVKKKPGRASKFSGNLTDGADIGTCKISAQLDNLVSYFLGQNTGRHCSISRGVTDKLSYFRFSQGGITSHGDWQFVKIQSLFHLTRLWRQAMQPWFLPMIPVESVGRPFLERARRVPEPDTKTAAADVYYVWFLPGRSEEAVIPCCRCQQQQH